MRWTYVRSSAAAFDLPRFGELGFEGGDFGVHIARGFGEAGLIPAIKYNLFWALLLF